MNLPLPNMRAAAAWFIAAVFFVSALTLIVWVVMDWYEER